MLGNSPRRHGEGNGESWDTHGINLMTEVPKSKAAEPLQLSNTADVLGIRFPPIGIPNGSCQLLLLSVSVSPW